MVIKLELRIGIIHPASSRDIQGGESITRLGGGICMQGLVYEYGVVSTVYITI